MGTRCVPLVAALVLASVASVALSACDGSSDREPPESDPPGVIIDWVDALRLNGVSYHALVQHGVGRITIPEARRGPRYAEVEQKLADNVFNRAYQPVDGDAAYLEAGAPIYEVEGFDPRFRVAAEVDGALRVYEAYASVSATTAGELFDLAGKVVRISVSAVQRPQIERGSVEDPDAVAAVVGYLLDAAVGSTPPVDASADETVLLTLHLFDGTTFQRLLNRGTGILQHGIMLPEEFLVALDDALDDAPGSAS